MRDQSIVRSCVRRLRRVFGQRNFYRAARLLMYEAQFDVLNEPGTNGEAYLQETVLRCWEDSVIFDIGANVGEWTASALRIGNSKPLTIHAFEPCAGTFQSLKARVGDHRGVHLVQMACSDHCGKAKLFVDAVGSGVNSIASGEFGNSEEVELTTVDAYCQRNAIPRIHFLKVDAEGHDLKVLAGAKCMLQDQRIDVVQFEYNHRWINERTFLRDAFDYLQPFGLSIGKLSGKGVQFYTKWHPELETFREGNYVACSENWRRNLNIIPAQWVPR